MTERDAYIALAYANRVPSLKGLPIINRIGSAAQFFNSSSKALRSYGLTEAAAADLIAFRQTFDAIKEMSRLSQEEMAVITLADEDYPIMLRELPDAPYALFVRGSLASLKKPTIAIVGTRRVSPYGLHASEYFSEQLSLAGATIVSGLALGVDTSAHRACVESGGTTIAVLGGGVNEAALYPKANTNLAADIIKGGGAIISEFPPDCAPTKYTFPLRNRIIAGLSRGVLVVEAPERSGALITAYLALEYNRDCFAVPADLFRANAAGSNALLAAGARIAINPENIAREYGLIAEKETADPIVLEGIEGQLYTLIKDSPRSIDELRQATGLDIPAISSMLSVMELNGYVRNIGDGAFSV